MIVKIELNTQDAGDLQLLAAITNKLRIDPGTAPAETPNKTPKTEDKLKAEDKPKTKAKKRGRPAKVIKEYKDMSFDELKKLLPTLDNVTKDYARFITKAFVVETQNRDRVVELLNDFGASDFGDLPEDKAGEFVESLLNLESNGDDGLGF